MIADRLKTVEAIEEFYSLSYDEQVQVIPEMEEAGHSGNSFGAACLFAKIYLSSPEQIINLHGALAPLVGSDAYLPLEERHAV